VPDSLEFAYSTWDGPILRPYLFMQVTGINGKSFRIRGIVDSGADGATIPERFTSQLGYGPATLRPEVFRHAGGVSTSQVATTQCTSEVPQFPGVIVPIFPSFSDVPFALWGQRDFMHQFDVEFSQSAGVFTLYLV
jgi:hypothetical protein